MLYPKTVQAIRDHERSRARERAELFHEGAYITDGRHLFRVVSSLHELSEGVLVELEDCRTLDVFLWPAEELEGRGLAPVASAAARAA